MNNKEFNFYKIKINQITKFKTKIKSKKILKLIQTINKILIKIK